MKINLILTSICITVMFLANSCEKDDGFYPESEVAGKLKSTEVKMIPVKGEVQSIITEYYEGVPVTGQLTGNMSHIGKLIIEKSVWETTSLTISEDGVITWEMEGTLCAANGDLLKYTLSGDFIISENKLTARADLVNGGTGRFEFAEGYLDITGYAGFDAENPALITTMYMKGEGLLSSVGSSKK